MKHMKIALAAMLAVVMGTTFTSCLNSDSSLVEYSDIVTIDYLDRVISDYGYVLDIQNLTSMKLNGSYPDRAIIAYNQIDGEDYSEGKASYKVYFTRYLGIMYIGEWSTGGESVTPINSLGTDAWASGNYLNITFTINYDDNTNPEQDFVLYPYEVESGVLYCRLVHIAEVEGTNTASLSMSFPLPSKTQLQSQFEDLTFTGDDNNIIEIIVTAGESTSNKFKATLK